MSKPQIEISLQASPADQRGWAEIARRCESSGFRALLVSDHPGSGASPFVALASAAAVTSTLRLGSYVVNAGVRDPLLLASEVATRPPPAGRVQHLIAVTTMVRELLAGGTVPADAAHGLPEAQLTGPRPVQEPVPVLVGGGNPALLRWGGAHADAFGLSGLGRTLPDGHAHTVSWSAAQLDTQVALVRDGAAGAGVAPPALEALVQHVELTVDREAGARPIAHEAELSVKSVLAVPYVLIGTIAQIVEQLRDMRERWGVTRWVVRTDALDVAEQVLVALRS